MTTSIFAGCSQEDTPEEVNKEDLTPEEYYQVDEWESQEQIIDDNYRNYYQVFVYSFADSD